MAHQGSSLFSSLGAALNAISHPNFSIRSSSLPSTRDPILQAFETDLASRLDHLKQTPDGAYLHLPWLHLAMEAILATNSAVEVLIPDLHFPLSDRDDKWVNDYLDDSAKLLDVCNVLKEGIADVEQYHMQVQLALRSVDSRDIVSEAQCQRARHALYECMEAMRRKDDQGQQRSKLESCSSTLRRMGEKLTSPSPLITDRGKAFLSAIYGAKVTTIFICGMFALSLSFKPRRSLPSLHVPSHFLWSAPLLSLQQKVKEEMDRGKAKGWIAHLQELSSVDASVRQLHEFLDNILVEKLIPLSKDHSDELRQLVDSLRAQSEELEKGLAPLEQQVNELFRMLVTSRVALLDVLSHARN
ncbi:hypothetical protein O6H91_21G008900 [Diphasiastrum complanatum]|uniref:Uncharacterized protein n=3 Tax=Diphasiastrum complanatum TaxID=34168 RepID=A0ACC2AHJ4_DIPCM|nr:hypothetical protein O6H91_Y190400 [Diphasiastrum complanatum]KAJ7517024.1 hypothetical protein O6H91_21G008900 [Diphasiastrum complanatum]